MKLLDNMKTTLTTFGGKASLELQKRSPEICLGLGLVGFVGTVVLACRATLKAEEILDRHAKRMEEANEAADVADAADDYDIRREKTVVWAHTVVDFAKLYAPCAAVGAVSVALLVKSHNILSGRYLGAVSAFNGVTEAFQQYRNRVIDEEGEEKDRHYRYGSEYEKVKVDDVDENGKKVKREEVHEIMNEPLKPSDTSRYFDESNPNWEHDAHYNFMFLDGVETHMNDILHSRGWLALNEVYDALGFEPDPKGQILGWCMDGGSGRVSFGLERSNREIRRFINGKENIVLLDFNVDGVIVDKIGKDYKFK